MEDIFAIDFYHTVVRNSLLNDGWTITNDPLRLILEGRDVFVDFGAERIIAAEKGVEKIAVEVKSFRSASPVADLEAAVGQYTIYEDVLSLVEPERTLYLAIPMEAYEGIFAEQIGKLVLERRIHRAFCYHTEREEITKWINYKP